MTESSRTYSPDYRVSVVWGTFLQRINRFAAEVQLGTGIETVHVPSSGRMRELLVSGAKVALLLSLKNTRKTKYTVAFAETDCGIVSIDSQLPNKLVRQWLREGKLKEFSEVTKVTPEVAFGSSRLDFSVDTAAGQKYLLEVKSVTLVENGVGLFPDAPTVRGRRHLRELIIAAEKGIPGGVIFVVQRHDATSFQPNENSDAEFAAELRKAQAAGVVICAYRCRIWKPYPNEIALKLAGGIPVVL